MDDYHERVPAGNGSMEADIDLDSEDYVRAVIEKTFSCNLVKQQTFDPMDFIAVREAGEGKTKTVSWVEVRRRYNQSDKYSEIFMGYEKFMKLVLCGFALSLPIIFVVVFDDCMKWIDLTKQIRLNTGYGSRGSMNHERATDKEKVVFIPVSRMKGIE